MRDAHECLEHIADEMLTQYPAWENKVLLMTMYNFHPKLSLKQLDKRMPVRMGYKGVSKMLQSMGVDRKVIEREAVLAALAKHPDWTDNRIGTLVGKSGKSVQKYRLRHTPTRKNYKADANPHFVRVKYGKGAEMEAERERREKDVLNVYRKGGIVNLEQLGLLCTPQITADKARDTLCQMGISIRQDKAGAVVKLLKANPTATDYQISRMLPLRLSSSAISKIRRKHLPNHRIDNPPRNRTQNTAFKPFFRLAL